MDGGVGKELKDWRHGRRNERWTDVNKGLRSKVGGLRSEIYDVRTEVWEIGDVRCHEWGLRCDQHEWGVRCDEWGVKWDGRGVMTEVCDGCDRDWTLRKSNFDLEKEREGNQERQTQINAQLENRLTTYSSDSEYLSSPHQDHMFSSGSSRNELDRFCEERHRHKNREHNAASNSHRHTECVPIRMCAQWL